MPEKAFSVCIKDSVFIDPPYNTGNDFVYEDDFAQSTDEYLANSGQFDDVGNRLVKNLDSNGRFHTDWLNMIYPRLKLARDLLTEDGVIFISIDDNEVDNLRKVCDEIFGECNFLAQITIITGANQSGDGVLIQKNVEYCFVYVKSILDAKINRVDKTDEIYRNLNDAPTAFETRLDMGYTIYYNEHTGEMIPRYDYNKNLIYTNDEKLVYSDDVDLIQKGFVPIRPGKRNGKLHRWRWSLDTFLERKSDIKIFKNGDKYTPKFLQSGFNAPKNIWNYTVGTIELKKLFDASVFDYSKNVNLLKYISSIGSDKDAIIVDFFSGSATTAHAVMQLNAEDGGHRKFIMVQLPEATDEKSEAYKAGYKTICEIGKERIRRAAKKIKEEIKIAAPFEKAEKETGLAVTYYDDEAKEYGNSVADKFDGGFRVLKCDSSNMKNVYYTPSEFGSESLDDLISNIKEDRTPEDLLFQVMLDLGILLSSKISIHNAECIIHNEKRNYRYFSVEDNFLIACFDSDITEEIITEIAKKKPDYFVMRDSSMATDSVGTNFEQIFATYSPDTVRKVL